MDLARLKYIIGTHRPMKLYNSLPFAVEENGERKVRWFVYDIVHNGANNELHVKQIGTMDNRGRINIVLNPDIVFKLASIENSKDFDEDEYYEEFAIAFNTNNNEELRKLLEDAECSESLKIYDIIANYKSSDN